MLMSLILFINTHQASIDPRGNKVSATDSEGDIANKTSSPGAGITSKVDTNNDPNPYQLNNISTTIAHDQVMFNAASLRIEVDLNNLQATFEEYLDTSNLRFLMSILNPNPKGEVQDVLDDVLVTQLNDPYTKMGAERMCGVLMEQLFFPKTAEHIAYLRRRQVSSIWTTLKPISTSSHPTITYSETTVQSPSH